jgi:CMP-N-acetylneuraminic acid synthetase
MSNTTPERHHLMFVIPARKHSKRCSDKNFREFINSESLVDIAVKFSMLACWHLRSNRGFTDIQIVVTSDRSPEDIIDESVLWRTQGQTIHDKVIVHHRPAELATDEAPTSGVIADAVNTYWNKGTTGTVVLVQPTSPFRTAATFSAMIKEFDPATLNKQRKRPSVTGNDRPDGNLYMWPNVSGRCDEWIFDLKHNKPHYVQPAQTGVPFNVTHGVLESFDIDTEIDFSVAQKIAQAILMAELNTDTLSVWEVDEADRYMPY